HRHPPPLPDELMQQGHPGVTGARREESAVGQKLVRWTPGKSPCISPLFRTNHHELAHHFFHRRAAVRIAFLPASVTRMRALWIGGPRSSTISTRTVASPARTRSLIVSNLNPRVSKAFTSQPCCVLASTMSTRRWLGRMFCFSGSATISLEERTSGL